MRYLTDCGMRFLAACVLATAAGFMVVFAAVYATVIVLAAILSAIVPANAGPDWQNNPICKAEEFIDASGFDRCRDWIRKVQQPVVSGLEDQSRPTCCSEADAYEADEFAIGPDGAHFAIVTRDYPDVPAGTRVFIPAWKFNLAYEEGGNPSGYGIIFMNGNMNVLCYFTPSLQ